MNKSLSILIASAALTGCITNQPKSEAPEPAASTQSTSSPAAKTESSKAAPTADNKKEVKGINNWTGYVQGTPAPKSKFPKLKIGMGQKEVMDLAGLPTDQHSHVTGKAFIPFYMGFGRYETVYYYKGMGRLRFAGNGGFSSDTGLVGIEHDASERGHP